MEGNKQDFLNDPILEGKIDGPCLVMRTSLNKFYWVSNVKQPQIMQFDEIPLLKNMSIDHFIFIPKEESPSKKVQLLITHPDHGVLIVKENYKDTYHLAEMDKGPIGKVKMMAFTAHKKLVALFCEGSGRLIVAKNDFTKELNRCDTMQNMPEQLVWVSNDITVLVYKDKLVFVGPRNRPETLMFKGLQIQGIHCSNEIDGLRVVTSEGVYFVDRV